MSKEHILEEAAAFDERIKERVAAGFIPDIRRARKCDYFYKSFWRDPVFIQLYLGTIITQYLDYISQFSGEHKKILDIGCGAGYVSLELARAGHAVHGIDISRACIDIAQKMSSENTCTEGFGSLSYAQSELYAGSAEYDVVLFSGVLHHMPNIDDAVKTACSHLKENGIMICHEPCHDKWRRDDAQFVAFLRLLMAKWELWYQEDLVSMYEGEVGFTKLTHEIFDEYVEERDKSEAGQSPHDNVVTGSTILERLQTSFDQLAYKPSTSFIYRFLGGLRGEDSLVHAVAFIIAAYEEYAVSQKILQPNYFYFAGKKKT